MSHGWVFDHVPYFLGTAMALVVACVIVAIWALVEMWKIERAAFKTGAQARQSGGSENDNPFHHPTLRQQWSAGFRTGEAKP